MDYPSPAKTPNIMFTRKKKQTCHRVDFAITLNRPVKMEESENIDKCLDPARELKRPKKMRVTVVPIANGALGRVFIGLK